MDTETPGTTQRDRVYNRPSRAITKAGANRKRMRWSNEERIAVECALCNGPISPKAMTTLCQQLGRSYASICDYARKLGYKHPTAARKPITVTALEKKTGYCNKRILTCIKRLGIVRYAVGETRPGVPCYWAIPEDAVPKIYEELKRTSNLRFVLRYDKGAWGVTQRGKRTPPECLGCGTTTEIHHAKGRCRLCYRRHEKLMRKAMRIDL